MNNEGTTTYLITWTHRDESNITNTSPTYVSTWPDRSNTPLVDVVTGFQQAYPAVLPLTVMIQPGRYDEPVFTVSEREHITVTFEVERLDA